MKKSASKQKGSTLVEVLVALSVFLIVMGTLVAGYLSSRKVVAKQKEYVYFAAICEDIQQYGEIFGENWSEKYFGTSKIHKFDDTGAEITAEDTTTAVASYAVYYNAKYETTESETDARFVLTYFFDDSTQLVLSVRNKISDYTIIDGMIFADIKETTT